MTSGENLAIHTLHVGEYIAVPNPAVYKTLLGSCVSACLYDEKRKMAGMNHFLLADPPAHHASNVMNSATGYYGIHAMELLINLMLSLGASRTSLKAKIFGGANVLNHYSSGQVIDTGIGEANVLFLESFLQTESIPVAARDVGGDVGRIVFFNNQDFSVKVRAIGYETKLDVLHEEAYYLRKEQLTRQQGRNSVRFLDRK